MNTDQTDQTDQTVVLEEAPRSRRALFGAAAVAAAAGAAALTPEVSRADSGDELILGERNEADNVTVLEGPEFKVTDGSSSGSLARRVDSVDSGVYGFTGRSARSRAVWGQDETANGIGVYGSHAGATSGVGVTGQSFNGTGVVALGTAIDAQFGDSGRVRFSGSSDVGPGSGGLVGTITRDPDGSLWYCVAANEWRRLSARNSGGSFTPVDPARVYDSRVAQPAPGALATGQSRVVSVALARNGISGAAVGELVPAGATAVAYNLTVDRTVGAGFLAVAPGNASSTSSSAINWSASGAIASNAGVVKLDAQRQIRVFCGGAATTDFLVDVTGYYL